MECQNMWIQKARSNSTRPHRCSVSYGKTFLWALEARMLRGGKCDFCNPIYRHFCSQQCELSLSLSLPGLMSVWHGSEHTPPHTIRVSFLVCWRYCVRLQYSKCRESSVWEKAHSKHRKSVIHSDACISTARRDVFTSLCWRWSSTYLCVFSDELSDVNSSYRLFCTRGIDIYVFSFSNRDCDPAVVVIVLLALVCLRQFELYGRKFLLERINEMFAVCEIWTILETKLNLIKVSG